MSNSLNRFDKFIFYYLVGFSPAIFGFTIWAIFKNFKEINANGILWDIFGLCFIAWVLALLYIVTKMLFSSSIREKVMTRLAGMKERDEREAVVAGNAAKFSFLSTLALLIFLFVFSITNLSVTKHPETNDKRHGNVMMGFNINAIDDGAILHELKNNVESFNYKSFPLSKPVMILLLIFWQVGSYHLVARKELGE